MRARQQAGFHMNRTAVDREAERAPLIRRVVGQRRIGFLQCLDYNAWVEQAPEIVTRQQYDLTTGGSDGSSHKRLPSPQCLLGFAIFRLVKQRDAVGLGPQPHLSGIRESRIYDLEHLFAVEGRGEAG